MAITLGKSPIIMTEAGDTIPADGRNWKVHTVRFVTTANSGVFVVLDKPGGRVLFQSKTMNANDADHLQLNPDWYDGFSLQNTAPAGGAVFLYYC